MPRFGRLAIFAELCLSLTACRSSEARAREAEAARLAQAIDAVRNAPNEAKAPLLTVLEGTECHDPKACEVKQTCVTGYRLLESARSASARAKALLAERDGGPLAALTAASEVTRAESDLLRASELNELCATAQGRLLRESKAR